MVLRWSMRSGRHRIWHRRQRESQRDQHLDIVVSMAVNSDVLEKPTHAEDVSCPLNEICQLTDTTVWHVAMVGHCVQTRACELSVHQLDVVAVYEEDIQGPRWSLPDGATKACAPVLLTYCCWASKGGVMPGA